jgi:hypothetical protein
MNKSQRPLLHDKRGLRPAECTVRNPELHANQNQSENRPVDLCRQGRPLKLADFIGSLDAERLKTSRLIG